MAMIPISEPDLGTAESEAVRCVTAEGWISTAGPAIRKFEECISALLGNTGCLALNSGTSALHLALHLVPDIQDSAVIIPDLTFAGTVNAVLMAGAEPILLDVDPYSWCMSPEVLLRFLESGTNRAGGKFTTKTGKPIAAVVYVPVHGNPGPVTEIRKICRSAGILLIEDAAAALGSASEEGPCGTLGDFSTLSFNGNKILTTGGGGMLCSRNSALTDKARHVAHQAKMPGNEYVHDMPGFNYGMTNLAAALGLAQAGRFSHMLKRKQEIRERYQNELSAHAGFQQQIPGTTHNGWLTTLLVNDRNMVMSTMLEQGIGCRPIWHPLHRLPFLQNTTHFAIEREFVSYKIYNQAISIPSGSALTNEQQDRVISCLLQILPS